MNLRKYIQKKWIIISFLILPGLIFLLPILDERTGAKLWGKVLKNSGFISTALLMLTLLLSPLTKLFPTFVFFKILNRDKREIGLGLFCYICCHCGAFLLKVYAKKGLISPLIFLRPVVLPGVLAFLLILPLVVTSNDPSIRTMGRKKWKRLHSLIYLTEGLVFIHMAIQGGKMFWWALAFFLPLLIFQLLRINPGKKKGKDEPVI